MPMKDYPNIPGYLIEKVLGEGGMGIVYLAVQTALDRKVALKVTLPSLAESDPSFTRRFVREAKATAALNHKNIITVYDAGEFEQSSYMAMEHIPTGTLADIKRASLSDKEICQLFIGICQGLGAAHKAGFVHRDIKPDNILIDEYGRPVVTDFGIVKSLGTKNTAITIAGGTIGTPQYMSPEQIKAEDLDGRSDLYSIGIMLYNLLEGHAPFSDPTPSAVYIMHVTTDPDPLSEKSKDFQPIITKLLQKDPADRYKDADELIQALKSLEKKASSSKNKKVEETSVYDLVTEIFTGEDEQPVIKTSSVTKKPVSSQKQNDSQPTKIKKPLAYNKTVTPPVTRKYVNQDSKESKPINKNIIFAGIAVALVASIIGFFVLTGDKGSEVEEPQPIVQQSNTKESVVDPDTQDWQNTQKQNTQQAYVDYIKQHPKGKYLAQAETSLQEIRDKLKQEIEEKQKALAELTQQSDTQELANSDSADAQTEQDDNTPSEQKESQTNESMASDETNDGDANSKISEIVSQEPPEVSVVTVKTETKQQSIDDLLMLAQADLDNWKLMSPKGKNAYDRYKKILALDSQNSEAKKGLLEIANKYITLAKNKAKANKFSESKTFVSNAIRIRQDYLAAGYDKEQFYGLSDAVSLRNLNKLKKDISNEAAIYKKQKQQQLAKRNSINNKSEFYAKGLVAYNNEDYQSAKKWLQQAADLNQEQAQRLMGDMYYFGHGVAQNDKLALSWYTKAANNKDIKAQNYLGKMYQQGSAVSQSYQKANEWYARAAKQGDAEAQYQLGHNYEKGLGFTQNLTEAINWYTKAAKQNFAMAQNRLGKMYYLGKGVSKDYDKSFRWYLKAAKQNLAQAQDNLGLMYFKGFGVKKDFEKSLEWYLKAANQGYADSQALVGAMYEYGRGVRKNNAKAVQWFKKAAKQGNKFAIKKLRKRGISKYD
jgi:TPR repeat protein